MRSCLNGIFDCLMFYLITFIFAEKVQLPNLVRLKIQKGPVRLAEAGTEYLHNVYLTIVQNISGIGFMKLCMIGDYDHLFLIFMGERT